MSLDKWHHKTFTESDGIEPSTYETYQLIAEVLVSGDQSLWKPTLEANNHWRNWPNAGSI